MQLDREQVHTLHSHDSDTPLVDIHCHLLPDVDDGPRGWAEVLRMARIAVSEGIRLAIATPHQGGVYGHVRAPAVRDKTRQLVDLLARHEIPLRVLPGAEVRIEEQLPQRLRDGRVLTLGDHGKHVLLELPHRLGFPLDALFEALRDQDLVAVVSRPERNRGLLEQRGKIPELVEQGCLMQLTSGSLLGYFGDEPRRAAEWMLAEGWAHVLATDAHGACARRPLFRRAFERAAELAGHRSAVILCCENPAAIAAGLPAVGRLPRPARRATVARWLPWRRAG